MLRMSRGRREMEEIRRKVRVMGLGVVGEREERRWDR